MKSIRTRLTVSYALSATITTAGLFVAGYQLLESHLIHGLDLLNAAEFAQIKAHLGPDYKTLSPQIIDQRIRETTDYASTLFYINIDSPHSGPVFYSTNLNGAFIPDVPGQRVYNAYMQRIGELRVAEFVLPPFDVSIATRLDQVQSVMRGYVLVCIALVVAMMGASMAIGFGLSRVMLRPIRLIRETASRIGSDNLSERIPVASVQDEISDLTVLLNQMFDRLESAFDQIRRFAAEASHELKTPLAMVRLHAEKLIVDGDLSPAHEEAVQVQLEEIARLNQIIDAMLFLSRAEAHAIAVTLSPHDPAHFLELCAMDACALCEHQGRRFEYTHSGEGAVEFEERWLRQVVFNLLANALHVTPENGCITLRSELEDGIWRVAIEDEGTGVPPEQRERIFERFVRLPNASETGTGAGLGLAICRSIIALHRGRIYAESMPGRSGLRVVFEIPAESASAKSRSLPDSVARKRRTTGSANLTAPRVLE